MNVTETSTLSGNMNDVQRIMYIFVGGCGTNLNEETIKQNFTRIGVELKKVEHLTTKCEWYKAYKISMKASDREEFMKSESCPQRIFVRKYFKARTGRNLSKQLS